MPVSAPPCRYESSYRCPHGAALQLRPGRVGGDELLGRKRLPALVDVNTSVNLARWITLLDDCLAVAGGLDGVTAKVRAPVSRQFSDSRTSTIGCRAGISAFSDYNQGVNAESFVYDTPLPAPAKVLMLYQAAARDRCAGDDGEHHSRDRRQAVGVLRDMSRQLWDEARHAMMGEVGFVALGLDWRKRCTPTQLVAGLNTEWTPLERHAVLYFIEQGLMPKTGKRYEWEVAKEPVLPLMATIQDYDWADEVLHAQLGREWYVETMPSQQEALAYGDGA